MTTMTVLDSTGATVAVEKPLTPGRAAATASRPVVLSNEDNATIGALTETAPATDIASSGLNGRLQRVAQRLSSLIALVPSALGRTTMAGSLSVALASDQAALPITDNAGSLTVDAPVGTPAFVRMSNGTAAVDLLLAQQLPGTLGIKTAANSLSIAHASDDAVAAATGATTDAAVANGAAGSIAGYLRSIKDAATDTTTASPVSAPTLTKGTQGANGFSVQELKDAGRSLLCMTAEFAFAQTAETLLTMTLSVDGAATTTFSSRVITSGKKFRIQAISATIESLGSGTAPQRAYLRLRRNTAGATIATSALQAVWGFVNPTAVVKSGLSMDYEVPDGLEMNGDGTATFGFTLETPDWVTTTATGRIKLTVIGIEF